MINKQNRLTEVIMPTNAKINQDIWEDIFNDLVLETEPPVRYIKDAVIITRNGASYRVSPDDYVSIVARAKTAGPENSDIHSCSLSIDFSRIKRDVNRWTNKFMSNLEAEIDEEMKASQPKVEEGPIRPVVKKVRKSNKKLTDI